MEPTVFTTVALTSLIALSNPAAKEEAKINTYTLPAIAGVWQLQAQTVCQERYYFGADGEMRTTSDKEITQGEYQFVYAEEASLPVLAFNTEYDNNKPDCAGNQIDQTGHSLAVFVKLDDKHDPKHMKWCSDQEAADCNAQLTRVLP